MKKLLTILGSVGLVATTGAVVVACGQKTAMSDKKQGEEKIVLAKLVKTRELGFVSKNENETIKKAFTKQNLTKEVKDKVEVEVTINGNGTNGGATSNNTGLSDSAVVTIKEKGNGGNNSKKVTVVFDVNNDLSKIVKVTKLKSLADNKDETIIAALDKANPKANLDSSMLMIERKDNKIILKPNEEGKNYTGQVEVHIESKTGVYVGLSLLSVALLASSGFIIYRSVKKKKKQM
ncbi:lipoprotein [Mycoplasma feriruminatoris]|uniref:Lipoprotein n=1 Tax=Mycoplasma feriruminatoris TaxID=1179777 RepID=A0ABY8HVF5_9MOLU|nr:lipoprotein [Mycoplasma feriruminatoris]WFQ93602.1 lipoprotein [Mycoplasma feriruminatoris]